MNNQKGNAVLFVLVCLPLVLTFAVLVVDVSRYQSSREQAQELADKIVLQAAKFLPNLLAARTYVQNQINAQNIYNLKSLEVKTDRIALSLETAVDSVFGVFLAVANSKKQSFIVNESVSAVIAPIDLAIIIPDGLSMRPEIKATLGTWPSSKYFSLISPPGILEQDASSAYVWPKWWNDFSSYGRWATQACYNPVFSAVKSFAISLLDTFLSFNNARVSVLTTPGNDPLLGYSLLLTANKEIKDSSLNYWEEDNYLSDELCVQIAEQNDYYKTFSPSSCAELLSNQTSKQLYYPRNSLSDCVYRGELSIQESVYYRSSRKNLTTEQNIFSALKQALAQIAQQPSPSLLSARANLSFSTKKEIILLIDSPVFNIQNLLTLWQETGAEQLQARLNIISFYSNNDFTKKNELDIFVNSLSNLNHKLFRVLAPVEPEFLVEKVLPELIESYQQILLRS